MDVATSRRRAGLLALLAFRGDDGFEVLTFATFLLTVTVGSAGNLFCLVQSSLFDFGSIHNVIIKSSGEASDGAPGKERPVMVGMEEGSGLGERVGR